MGGEDSGARVVLVTAGSEEEGRRLAGALVEGRLAACCNIVRGVRSVYRWEGQVHDDEEVLLLIKTTTERLEAVMRRVRDVHSYSVPEIIALPIVAGFEPYMKWLREQCA